MILTYNHFQKAEPSKMYLARPNHKIIKPLFGIESAKLTAHLNDIWEIKFEIDSKDNPVFDQINQYMEIKVDNLGWFRIDGTPEKHYSDGRYYKTFIAYGYETTLQDIDINLFYVNCGTDVSIEMYEQNVNELGIPNNNIQFYIEESSDDPTSDNYWKLGLMNILQHEYLHKKGWTIGDIDMELTYLRGRQFEIDSKTVYAFLTQDVAVAYKCMFIFDRENQKIHAKKIENLGNDLNIELSLRNVINTISITDQNDKIYNSFRCAGADDDQVLLEYINFGSDKLQNYDYFIETGMIPEETANKYKIYEEYKDSKRQEYANFTLESLEITEQITALKTQVPIDEVEIEYDNLTLEELELELGSAQAVVALLEEMHTVDGELQIESTADYAMYISFKEVVIPKIEAAIANYDETAEKTEVADWTTNWELYGINELTSKKKSYESTMELMAEKGYDEPYDSSTSTVSEEIHNKQYELYLKYANYVADITERLNKLQAQVDELNERLSTIDTERNTLVASVDISNEQWGFTPDELQLLNILTVETDFKDTTIEILDTDTLSDIIELAWDLYDSANEELQIESRPQLSFDIDLDNLFHIAAFKEKANMISMGDFIFMELVNGYKTKQRLIRMELELSNFNDTDLAFEFSDTVTVYGKADDYRFLLENTNSSSKSSISKSVANNQYISGIASTVALEVLKKYGVTGSSGGSVFPNGISDDDLQKLVDALSGLIDGKLSVEELKAEIAKIDTLEADSAFIKYINSKIIVSDTAEFKTLEAKLALIDDLLAGNVSAELGHIIKLTADNVTIDEAVIKELIAAQILVSDLKAGDITLSDSMRILSENGAMVMNGETLQIMGTASDGSQYVAIQLGYDATNNPSLIIRDETGAIMLDASGLHEAIVPDGLIKNDMISDGVITKEKLAFTAVEQNEDGSINVSDVVIDGTGVKQQFVTIKQEIESNIQPELDDLQNQITTNKTSISSVSSDVDAINKKIVNMVTQDDISEAINEYDSSSVESMRTRITKTEQDISGITTTISDVQSSLTNKADSSTVQTLSSKVTTIETTVNGVKTTVESNYTELRKDLDSIEVGGRNLIKDTDILYERDNAATAIETYSLNVYPKHLPDIPNRTLTFSFYLHSTGTRDTNLSSDTTLHDYFGISGTILWSDSTGANTDASTITLFTENLSVSNSNSRVSQTVTISPPDGYDTIDAFLFSVQLYAKPASDNDETWQIGYPKLEFGNQDTDWTPAPEDMATQDDINDISNNISETVIQIQTLSEQIIGDDGITSRVTQLEQTTGSMESNILNQCETLITQSASSWRADFEENGATVGKVIISQQGITVQSDGDDKHTALIAGGRFSGYYNPLGTTDDDLGEEIFTLTEDKVVASQLFAKNGADFNSLRIMPFTNEGYVGCVWVKSGGDS